MNTHWQITKLGDLLQRSDKTINPLVDAEYKEITVRMWGKGVVERGRVIGAALPGRRFVARAGQFIASRIDARNGAMGLVPQSLDGALVTNDFPLFDINTDKLEPAFLGWLSRTARFVELCQRASEGTTNRVRLKEDRFQALEIALPSLVEQKRIVDRIDEFDAQIRNARALRQQSTDEIQALLASASSRLFEAKPGWQLKSVGEFCEHPQYGYTESATTEAVGPRFLRITDIQDGRVNWATVPYCRCPDAVKYLLKPNDLVFARTGATTGKSFVIRDCPEAVFASYLIRLRVRDTVSVDYLYRYFQTSSYWDQIADQKKGTGQPNLNGSKLAKLTVPIAPPDEQKRIVARLETLEAEVEALKHLQAGTAIELDAMMPSILNKAFSGAL